jgi:hypothetical protein
MANYCRAVIKSLRGTLGSRQIIADISSLADPNLG